MRPALRYALSVPFGLALGVAFAIHTVRAGAFGSNISIGPWQTGLDFGTADASARTRAVVALRGLLALPAREARYYTAATDDAGRPLDGRCRYRVEGGTLPGRWWSLTLYDRDGYLVRNPANIFSVESASVAPFTPGLTASDNPDKARILRAIFAAEGHWRVGVAPARPADPSTAWLPTGSIDRFELTLRIYLPSDAGRGNPLPSVMPHIVKEGC